MDKRGRERLDFKRVRAVPLTAVLARLGLIDNLRRSGPSLVGSCPICDAGAKSKKVFTISINRTPQLWRCFAPGHNRGGDVLTFVSEFENIEVKQAAASIARWFAIECGQPRSNQRWKTRSTTMTDANPNRPTHKVYSASKREGQKDFLTRIGSAWPFTMKDGKAGLNIQLTAMPIGERMVLFEYDDEEPEEQPEKKTNGRKK